MPNTYSNAGAFVLFGILGLGVGGLLVYSASSSYDPDGAMIAMGWLVAAVGWALFQAGLIGMAVRGKPMERPTDDPVRDAVT